MPHWGPWQRLEQPALSALTTGQGQRWCSVQLYSPAVIFHDGRWKMWFLGNSSFTRNGDMDLGYAESDDGLTWMPHENNPLLTAADLPPSITAFNTPHVLWDADEQTFKMWFAGGSVDKSSKLARIMAPDTGVQVRHVLCYATSCDGLRWAVHPHHLLHCVRSPCVFKDEPGQYTMYANADADPPADGWLPTIPGSARHDLGLAVFRFVSNDGLTWVRDAEPAVTSAQAGQNSIVYPFVHRGGPGSSDRHEMWFGCHRPAEQDAAIWRNASHFEIFSAVSDNGHQWRVVGDGQPSFTASRDRNLFDGRFVSTPCVVTAPPTHPQGPQRRLMFYSARDCGQIYAAGDGTLAFDSAGIYRHIGVAISEETEEGEEEGRNDVHMCSLARL